MLSSKSHYKNLSYRLMKIGILKELEDNRVSLIPATVNKLKPLGFECLVEQGAGLKAFYPDKIFEDVGASVKDRQSIIQESDILISIHPLSIDQYKSCKKNVLLISMFAPFNNESIENKLEELELSAISLDMIPRSTLAQSMDVLSSMASVAGYKSILEASNILPRYIPMMITAAGSIKPARVLILGAGVAGLQAIATAKRLGAIVEAFDTRSAAKEEVESLGAKFVEVEGAIEDKDAGGYGVEQSEDFIKRQRQEVQNRAMNADIIVTTAQVRGRKAPILVPKETVEQMKKGSVIIDLASSTGGNCELSEDQKLISHKGVWIMGNSNLAGKIPQDSSTLFSNNIFNLLKHIFNQDDKTLKADDPIVQGALITNKTQ
jgi:NAD(P) transhydrogenase subunit alpha